MTKAQKAYKSNRNATKTPTIKSNKNRQNRQKLLCVKNHRIFNRSRNGQLSLFIFESIVSFHSNSNDKIMKILTKNQFFKLQNIKSLLYCLVVIAFSSCTKTDRFELPQTNTDKQLRRVEKNGNPFCEFYWQDELGLVGLWNHKFWYPFNGPLYFVKEDNRIVKISRGGNFPICNFYYYNDSIYSWYKLDALFDTVSSYYRLEESKIIFAESNIITRPIQGFTAEYDQTDALISFKNKPYKVFLTPSQIPNPLYFENDPVLTMILGTVLGTKNFLEMGKYITEVETFSSNSIDSTVNIREIIVDNQGYLDQIIYKADTLKLFWYD